MSRALEILCETVTEADVSEQSHFFAAHRNDMIRWGSAFLLEWSPALGHYVVPVDDIGNLFLRAKCLWWGNVDGQACRVHVTLFWYCSGAFSTSISNWSHFVSQHFYDLKVCSFWPLVALWSNTFVEHDLFVYKETPRGTFKGSSYKLKGVLCNFLVNKPELCLHAGFSYQNTPCLSLRSNIRVECISFLMKTSVNLISILH